MKSIFILFSFLCLSFSVFGQKITTITADFREYSALDYDDNVFFLDRDSVSLDSTVLSTQEVQIAGKCNGWNEASCGILNLAIFTEKTARKRGYNAVRVIYYSGTDKKDTLGIVFYRLSNEKMREIELEKTGKFLFLINPKSNTEKDVKINDEKMTIASGKYAEKEIKTDNASVRLGGGLLVSSAQLGFKTLNRRFFIINGSQMTGGAPRGGGIGIGFSAPTIMEIGEVAGRIFIKYSLGLKH